MLITHDGKFHADDVVAGAILRLAGYRAAFLRTRDKSIFAAARPDDIIFDVGLEYDPGRRRFDHHQGTLAPRPNDVPYAAAGLIWKHHGSEAIREVLGAAAVAGDPRRAELTMSSVDTKIASVDAADNGFSLVRDDTWKVRGVGPIDLSQAIDAWNPPDGEPREAFDSAYETVVAWAGPLLTVWILRAWEEVPVVARIRAELEASFTPDRSYAVLSGKGPWQDVVLSDPRFDHLLYVIYRDGDAWAVKCVPEHEGSFSNRKSLPRSWWAQEGAELAEVTGLADAIFCHHNGFLVKFRSKESAEKAAMMAATS
jgi:uncharacterized UPF0160 family protein